MTKRLTAWTLALLLIAACFAFTACKDEAENSSEAVSDNSEVSVPEIIPKTPKEILADAAKNTYGYAASADWLKEDAVNGSGYIVTDKSNGQKIEFDITADQKSKLFSGNLGLCADDEKAVFNIIGSDKDVFLGIDGITELPMKLDSKSNDNEELTEGAKALFAVIAEVLESDVVNDLYRTETGDITIGEVEYENDTLVIFELDNKNIEAISDAIKTKTEANSDAKAFIETISELLNKNDDESEDEPKFDLNDIKYTLSYNVTSVIRDEKIAASKNTLKFDIETEGTKISLNSNSVQNGNNAKGDVSIIMTVPGDTELEIPDTTITYSMPYSVALNDKGYTVTVSEISMEQGMKITIPFEISVVVEFGEKSIGCTVSAKTEMGEVPFEMEASVTISACDAPEIKLPEEFVTEDEFDKDGSISEKLIQKYPKIFESFGSVI